MSVAILGGGAFGTALAIALGQTMPVTLWARDLSGFTNRCSPRLPGLALPASVDLTDDLAKACAAQTLLFAVPMQQMSGLFGQIDLQLKGKALVACCKGFDLNALVGPSALLAARYPDAVPAILTGPSFADDIARLRPTALTLACADVSRGPQIQHSLSTPTLRLYLNTDTIGAEVGGALKNVIAIACGAAIGAQLGESARAALMTRGFAEMQGLATTLGAEPTTLTGLSGLGDLALTCGSDKSRNFRFGLALGHGKAFDPELTVEGAATAQAVCALAGQRGLSMPITQTVAALCEGRLTVANAMAQLLQRPLKEEH